MIALNPRRQSIIALVYEVYFAVDTIAGKNVHSLEEGRNRGSQERVEED